MSPEVRSELNKISDAAPSRTDEVMREGNRGSRALQKFIEDHMVEETLAFRAGVGNGLEPIVIDAQLGEFCLSEEAQIEARDIKPTEAARWVTPSNPFRFRAHNSGQGTLPRSPLHRAGL